MTYFNRRKDSKYGAKRVTRDGRSFMSKAEGDCYEYLKLLEAEGEIRDLCCQVSVTMTDAALRWVLDFKFFDVNLGEEVYADYKGFETERWNILKKLWVFYGPARLRVYKGQGLRMKVAQEIVPKAKGEA